MLLGTPCDHIVAVLDHSDTTQPFIVTAYPALKNVFDNQYHHANYVSGLCAASMN